MRKNTRDEYELYIFFLDQKKKWNAVVIDHFSCRLIFLRGSCTPFWKRIFWLYIEVSYWCYLWNENSALSKCVNSIDDLNTRSSQFYIKTEEGARGQDSGKTERERGRENECRLRKDAASVIKRTVRK